MMKRLLSFVVVVALVSLAGPAAAQTCAGGVSFKQHPSRQTRRRNGRAACGRGVYSGNKSATLTLRAFASRTRCSVEQFRTPRSIPLM